MGILSRMARPKASLGPYVEQLLTTIYGGGSTSSGFAVNSDSAMRLITIQNCVRVRAFTLNRLPCHMMEKVGKLKNKAEDFYLYELLHDQPNSYMTASEFWGMAEAHVSLCGNFYAYKIGIPGRPIQQLIPLSAGTVSKVTQNADYSLTYDIRFKSGEIRQVSSDYIFHVKGLVLNGYEGVNPIEYARETIGMGLAGVNFMGEFFSKGMRPGAIFKHPLALSAPAHANMKKNLIEKYKGLGKHWETMLLDENMNVEFPQIKPVDAQFLEQMKMTEAQICGLYRVPLMMIQAGDKPDTYASSEQRMLSYVVHSIDVMNYEQAIRRDLLNAEEKKRYYAKFELKGLLRGAFTEQMSGFQIGVNTEILSPNEARSALDMNPYEGGDEYRTRTSTIKQDTSGQDAGSKPDKNTDKGTGK